MDRATRPLTFDNYDYETGSIRITPHTPCPVLLGIRGLKPKVLEDALSMLEIKEPVSMYKIFVTNQATDAHYIATKLEKAAPYTSVMLRGWICSEPRISTGGHVFVDFSDGTGRVTLAAYEETKNFRFVVTQLIPGDEVVVYGALKPKPHGLTLNLEKLEVVRLAERLLIKPPICPTCGRRTESIGYGKGYRCDVCDVVTKRPATERVTRELRPGIYEVTTSARRHLAMPIGLRLAHYQHGQRRAYLL